MRYSAKKRLWVLCLLLIPCSSLFAPIVMAQTIQGTASYYSKRATGARTANGERLHHDSMTCAHRTFPFGTLLRVTNPANTRTVIVRVNDRGPFVKGRIIDLSWGAAQQLGIHAQGIARVIIERLGIYVPFRDTAKTELNLPRLELEEIELRTGLLPNWHNDSIDARLHEQLRPHIQRKIDKSWLDMMWEHIKR